MELREAIRTRRSVRSFRPDPVPDGVLDELLEAACLAPSAGNLQAREFVVVRNPATRAALAEAAGGQEFVAEAPVVIVVCTTTANVRKYGERGRELYAVQDAAAATENLMLAATGVGLGTCWVGAFDEDEVRRILAIPNDARPVALLPLGRPAERPEPRERLPLSKVVHRERW